MNSPRCSKLQAASNAAKRNEKDAPRDEEPGQAISVGLSQRAFPLIDMLERAAKAGNDVVWGV